MQEAIKSQQQEIEQYQVLREPFYLPLKEEVQLFKMAHQSQMPVMLKGPTGCGKTRFVEHMAYKLKVPLITVACHEDLTASDLVGRYLLKGEETIWMDGPLALAAKHGAICYLDEVVEARKDTTVVIHPLTDTRRMLPVEKRGQAIEADDDFMLVISYNPGYQSVIKDLKQSTRQRFLALEFDYPAPEQEAKIVQQEAGIDAETAKALVKLGEKVRNLKNHGLEEGVSTRLLIYAATLIEQGIDPVTAGHVAIAQPITDDADMQQSIREIITTIF